MATSKTTAWTVKDDRRYDTRHHWVKTGERLLTVGITDYTQDTAGEILYVALPEPGTTLVQGKPFGSIESGKWVGQLYAPCDGTVIAANDQLAQEPDLLNRDPYQTGWLIKMVASSEDAWENLLTPDAYREHLAGLDEPGNG